MLCINPGPTLTAAQQTGVLHIQLQKTAGDNQHTKRRTLSTICKKKTEQG